MTNSVSFIPESRPPKVQFFNKEIQDIETGKWFFKPYIQIQPDQGVADLLQTTEREATTRDKWQYSVEWEQFAREHMQDPNKAHTPLELLFAGEPSIIVTLKDHGIHSVEQGANFPTARFDEINKNDAVLARELADYQRRCQEYLKRAEEALPYQEMQREIASRGDTVRQLLEEMQRMQNKLAEITKQQVPHGQRALYPKSHIPLTEEAQIAAGFLPDPKKAVAYNPQLAVINGRAGEQLKDLQRARGKRR
jgi:hypothetical protein